MTTRDSKFDFFGLPLLVCLAVLAATPSMTGCGDNPVVDNDTNLEEDASTGSDVLEPDQIETGDDARTDVQTDVGTPADSDQPGDDLNNPDTTTADDLNGSDSTTPTDEGTVKDTAVVNIECQEPPTTPVIKVNVYNDGNSSSKTDFAQSRTSVDTPIAGIPVSLIAPAEGSGETCDEGWYYFGPDAGESFTDGVRVLKVDTPDCRITSHNMARRTPVALAGEKWKMLIFGDSIPKQGPAPGEPYFFDNIAADLDGFGEILIENVAFSGSTSSQWLPSTSNFTTKVQPRLAESDVVFVSLGGNDIMHYLYYNSNKPLIDLMEGITDTIATVESNLADIFAAVREGNPDVDLVWLVYPNYAESDTWAEMTGEYAGMVSSYFEDQMYGIISWAAGIDGLIMVDLFSRMSKEDLDASLADELHYNAYGHKILGDELLKVLNGVKVTDGEPVIGGERFIGVNCDK